MAEAFRKRFEIPDETRIVPKAFVEILNLGDVTAMRATYEPGWKWSVHLKPIVGTEWCEVNHIGYMISGSLVVKMIDGTEITINAGDAVSIPPGHDAWVAGNGPCVFIDFHSAAHYAKRKEPEANIQTSGTA